MTPPSPQNAYNKVKQIIDLSYAYQQEKLRATYAIQYDTLKRLYQERLKKVVSDVDIGRERRQYVEVVEQTTRQYLLWVEAVEKKQADVLTEYRKKYLEGAV